MKMDLDRVRENVTKASTEDLLDRATVYRNGMERAALEIIDAELHRRGVTPAEIQEHWETKRANVLTVDSVARRCSFCDRPAVYRRWGIHWLWGTIPTLIPRLYQYCELHVPAGKAASDEES
ncbi:MAG TPA: hypothetical protein VGZ47_23150 [Gemmataceae bacterium]|jgi:hypothetical protein|nr:hypothetical protein [Gemmataceae bacterium]